MVLSHPLARSDPVVLSCGVARSRPLVLSVVVARSCVLVLSIWLDYMGVPKNGDRIR